MNENQKHIYYIAGDNMEILKSSPFIDRFTKNGFDVLFMTDPVDEYMCQRLVQYKESVLTCITKGDIELPNTSDSDKDLLKTQQTEYKPLCDYIKRIYNNFTDVKITNKIYELPCIVSSPENGFSANMEKIIKSQTLGQNENSNGMLNKRVLELNPLHPIIKKIKNINDTDEYNSLRDLLDLVINSALLYSGYNIIKPVEFSKKVINVVMLGMDINSDEVDNVDNVDIPIKPPGMKDPFNNVETIDMTNVD